MELDTKYFGVVRCSDESVLHFSEGLFGFEEEKEFVLIPFDGGDEMLLCFQSVNTPQLAFAAMNPFFLDKTYAPVLSEKDLASFQVGKSEDLCYYTLCVVKDPIGDSTINLKCPIVIREDNRVAKQVILEQYEMRHLLSDFSKKQEDE